MIYQLVIEPPQVLAGQDEPSEETASRGVLNAIASTFQQLMLRWGQHYILRVKLMLISN